MKLEDYRLADCALLRPPPRLDVGELIEAELLRAWTDGASAQEALDQLMANRELLEALARKMTSSLEYQRKLKLAMIDRRYEEAKRAQRAEHERREAEAERRRQAEAASAAQLREVVELTRREAPKEAESERVSRGGEAEPVEEAPVDEVPVDEVPVDEVPSEEAPVEEVPVDEVPSEEAPVEEVPAEEVPADEVPVEEVPVEEVPAEEVPVDEVPVEEVPSEEAPSKEATLAEENVIEVAPEHDRDGSSDEDEVADAPDSVGQEPHDAEETPQGAGERAQTFTGEVPKAPRNLPWLLRGPVYRWFQRGRRRRKILKVLSHELW